MTLGVFTYCELSYCVRHIYIVQIRILFLLLPKVELDSTQHLLNVESLSSIFRESAYMNLHVQFLQTVSTFCDSVLQVDIPDRQSFVFRYVPNYHRPTTCVGYKFSVTFGDRASPNLFRPETDNSDIAMTCYPIIGLVCQCHERAISPPIPNGAERKGAIAPAVKRTHTCPTFDGAIVSRTTVAFSSGVPPLLLLFHSA